MILRMDDLRESCSKILLAVDSTPNFRDTETLEIKAENQYVNISVTNREYYVRVKIFAGNVENFQASVNAKLFLKLVAQITTETLEIEREENHLLIKGNGVYKLPLIFDGEKLLDLPEIKIENVTSTFPINTKVLHSLITYNSKELRNKAVQTTVQTLYYLDHEGAITFQNCACVNSFSLEKPVRVLLNDKLVRLLKLFATETVNFSIGYDPISDEIVQTKVKFENDTISLTAILQCDDRLLGSFPVDKIRESANKEYPYSCVLNKEEFQQALGRLQLFVTRYSLPFSLFEFNADGLRIWDSDGNNSEFLYYENGNLSLSEPYKAYYDILDYKVTLDSTNEKYVNINFGEGPATVIQVKDVKKVIPQCN